MLHTLLRPACGPRRGFFVSSGPTPVPLISSPQSEQRWGVFGLFANSTEQAKTGAICKKSRPLEGTLPRGLSTRQLYPTNTAPQRERRGVERSCVPLGHSRPNRTQTSPLSVRSALTEHVQGFRLALVSRGLRREDCSSGGECFPLDPVFAVLRANARLIASCPGLTHLHNRLVRFAQSGAKPGFPS